MKKILFCMALFSLFWAIAASKINPVFASGNQTVQINSSNGVMYLTTSTSSNLASGSAYATNSANTTPIVPGTGYASSIGSLINFLLQVAIVIAVLLMFGQLILGALQWITSGGEKGKTEAARNKIISALIGLLIVAASYAIFTLVLRLLGFVDLASAINGIGTINGGSIATSSAAIQTATSSSQLQQQNLVP